MMTTILHSLNRILCTVICVFASAAVMTSNTLAADDDTMPSLRLVHLPEAEIAPEQKSAACPNNICPGLGNVFYVPSVNALSIQTGGGVFFKSRALGECATIFKVAQNTRTFKISDSMEHFVRNTMAEANVSGSYKSLVLSASGTAQSMTGYSADLTSTFHSAYLDITAVTHSIDFKQDPECYSAKNLHPDFLRSFEALALIATDQVGNPAQWSPYVEFLKNNGSHILMQQHIGSRFQQWESSTSEDSDIENTLKAKACAEVEGVTATGAGWSVKGCAAYSSDEKRKAMKSSTASSRVILGGTAKTRAGLTKDVSEYSLNTFIDSAQKGEQPIRFMFRPIWELLSQIYSPQCQRDGHPSAACQNLQRATNLQAAYEGWVAVGCRQLADNRGSIYQTMAIAGTTTQGINTYKCSLSKTGCRTNDDCHLGGAGSVCYCYGSGCIDQGDVVSGTDMFRNEVRGNQHGSYSDGVNNSCYYKIIAHCNCDTKWSGGLPARNIYQQSAP